MLRQYAKTVSFSLYLGDIALTAAAFVVAYYARSHYPSGALDPLFPFANYVPILVGVIALWTFLLYWFGLYESHRVQSSWIEVYKIAKTVVAGTVLLWTFLFVTKAVFASRLFTIFFVLFNFLFLTLFRVSVRRMARFARRRGYNIRHVLIVGTGSRAREIGQMVHAQKHWGFRLVGFVSDAPSIRLEKINGYPVLGTVGELKTLLERYVIDELIFSVTRKRLEEMEDLFLFCEERGVRTRVALNFFPHRIARIHLEDFQGVPLLTFTTTPQNEFFLAVKQGGDVVVSVLFLVLLSPLFCLIAVLIKISSPGPIFYKQTRVGLNGRRFTLYKFRTMHLGADAVKQELIEKNEIKGPAFKMKSDPRVIGIGRILRRFSLDELPQLLNVIKGDMSLVGPRPPLPDEVEQYQLWHHRRLSMKPGLTCLWQINGRSEIADFDRWMELDLQYIDNWSLKLDAKIFFKTIVAVLSGRGAS